MIGNPLSEPQILELPPLVDLPTAGRALGLSRSTSYALAAAEAFPVAVLRFGPRSLRVRSAELRRLLLLEGADAPPGA